MQHDAAIINALARISADEGVDAYLDTLPAGEQLDALEAIDCETPAAVDTPAPRGDSASWAVPF